MRRRWTRTSRKSRSSRKSSLQLKRWKRVMQRSVEGCVFLSSLPDTLSLWDGPSGHLADPTPNTSYEPKFRIDVSSEQTPINLPTRNMSFPQEYDATITASEDLNLPRHSGASSSSQHSAASRVPPLLKLGSLGSLFESAASEDCLRITILLQVGLGS